MALEDTAASLKESHGAIRAALDAMESHVTRMGGLLEEVDAVVAIANDPAMRMMEQALPAVPRGILNGIVTMLEAVIAQHAQPAPAQVPEGDHPEQSAA